MILCEHQQAAISRQGRSLCVCLGAVCVCVWVLCVCLGSVFAVSVPLISVICKRLSLALAGACTLHVANAELSGLFYAGHFPDMPFGVYTPAIGSDVLKKEIKDSEENVEIVRYQRKIDFFFFCIIF